MGGIAPPMLSEQRMLGRKRPLVEFIGLGSFNYRNFIVDQRRWWMLPLVLEWNAP